MCSFEEFDSLACAQPPHLHLPLNITRGECGAVAGEAQGVNGLVMHHETLVVRYCLCGVGGMHSEYACNTRVHNRGKKEREKAERVYEKR